MAQVPKPEHKQTYDNYHRDYVRTENGKAAKLRAQARYRRKLSKLYGLPYYKARLLHKANLDKVKEDGTTKV